MNADALFSDLFSMNSYSYSLSSGAVEHYWNINIIVQVPFGIINNDSLWKHH